MRFSMNLLADAYVVFGIKGKKTTFHVQDTLEQALMAVCLFVADDYDRIHVKHHGQIFTYPHLEDLR